MVEFALIGAQLRCTSAMAHLACQIKCATCAPVFATYKCANYAYECMREVSDISFSVFSSFFYSSMTYICLNCLSRTKQDRSATGTKKKKQHFGLCSVHCLSVGSRICQSILRLSLLSSSFHFFIWLMQQRQRSTAERCELKCNQNRQLAVTNSHAITMSSTTWLFSVPEHSCVKIYVHRIHQMCSTRLKARLSSANMKHTSIEKNIKSISFWHASKKKKTF